MDYNNSSRRLRPLGSRVNCATCPYITNRLTSYTCKSETRDLHGQYNRCNLQYVSENKRGVKRTDLTNTDEQSTKLTLSLNPLMFLNTFSLTLTILILTCS